MKIVISLLLLVIASSCSKENETISPSVLVKIVCEAPIYYAEIQHKEMFSVGDTINIIYNQMPAHQMAFPNPRNTEHVTVVIISK
jgi:hypothetical protein